MAGINDRDRLGSAGGAPTRYTISRSRSSSRTNPTQIDILDIDDRKARKTLEDFYDAAKGGAKSTSDSIRRMWTLSTEYSDSYRKDAISNIDKVSKELDKRYDKEVEKINRIIDAEKRRDALTDARRKYNLEQIKLMKQENSIQNQALSLERERSKLKAKYGNTKIGRQIQQVEELRIKIDNEYARANSGNLTPHELFEIADHTDELEGQLAEANRKIEESIDRSEKRTEGIKAAIKGFLEDAVTILTHNYIEGVQGYFDSYESTFTEFAGRLGTDYNQTRQFYSDIISKTFSNSMNEASNISKEMIPAVQNALRQGFIGDDAIAKAIADEQSRILMPWLDTQSDAWVNMSFNMSKQNIELLKTQQLQLQTSKAGNRLLQSGVINSMTSEMEPLLRNIDLNTGGANNLSEEGQAMMASLVEQGMSAQDAYALVLNAVNVQKDVYGALTSGDVTKVLMGQAFAEGKGLFGQFENVSGLYRMASNGDYLSASALNDILNLNMIAGTPEIAREIFDAIKDKGSFINISDKRWKDIVKGVNGRLTETKQQENVQQNDAARVGEWITAIPQGDKWFTAIINLLKGISVAIIGGKVTSVLVDFLASGKVGSGIVSTLKGLFGSGGSFTGAGSALGKFIGKAGWVALAYLAVENFYTSWKAKNKVDEYGDELTETSGEALTDNKYMSVNAEGVSSTEENLDFKGITESSSNAYNSTVSKANEDKSSMVKGAEWIAKNISGLSDNNIQQNISEYISPGAASGNKYKVALTNSAKMLSDNNDPVLSQMLKAYEDSGLMTEDWMWGWLGGDKEYAINQDGSSALSLALNEFRNNGRLIVPNRGKALGFIDTGYDRGLLNRSITGTSFTSDTGYTISDFDASKYYDSSVVDDSYIPEFLVESIERLNNLVDDRRRDIAEGRYNPKTDIVPISEYSHINDPDRQNIPAYKYFMYDNYKADVIDYYDTYKDAIDKLLKYPIDYYAIGSPYITEDQLAFVHQGERILTSRQNEAFGEIGSTGLLLAGSTLINKLLGFSNLNTDDDISREDMTDTLVESLDRVTAAISGLAQNNGIDYSNRTLPRITNNYNSNLVNLVPSISTSK